MSTKKPTKKEIENWMKGGVRRVLKNRDYSKDPFFVKKLEDAKEFLRKNPIPESYIIKD